jgi:peptidoglycan/LPS O-acetylase OafA/YrhL
MRFTDPIRSSTQNRDFVIDILRSGAILYIVGFLHIRGYSTALSSFHVSKPTHLLTCCVLSLFVYLSGFLLSQKNSFDKPGDILMFYRRRFLRIYPMYLIVLTLFFALKYIKLRSYIEGVLLMNMFAGQKLKTLWFVTMIVIFYAITPLYLKTYKPKRIILYTFVTYFGLIMLHLATNMIDLRLPRYLPVFAAGIIIARSANTQKILHNKYIVVISVLCFILFSWIFSNINNEILIVLVTTLASFAAIPVFLALAKTISYGVNRKLAFILSYSSFSLYLVHRITFGLGTLVYKPETIGSAILYLGCVLLPTTIAIAYIFQMLYDKLYMLNKSISISRDQ